MIASDVVSLAKSLSWWEAAEYTCAGLVTLACFGEYIADFTNWFTDGLADRKERLARRSTLLLIAALALELICLVRTNTLSGLLIGSLDVRATEAESKAADAVSKSGTALSQAQDALAKSGAAQDSLGKAESEATGAHSAAANALTLARGARREADSFEREITVAKNNVALLQSLVSARHVVDGNPLTQLKTRFKGRTIFVVSLAGDEESREFCLSIASALETHAEMKPIAGCGGIGGGGTIPGVFIESPDFAEGELLSDALVKATHAAFVVEPNDPKNPAGKLRIFVGTKNPFWIGK